MAASPKFKVFNPQGEYVASCKHLEDAAAVCAVHGDGAEIRMGHRKSDTLYHDSEAMGEDRAENSVDGAALIAIANMALPFSKRRL